MCGYFFKDKMLEQKHGKQVHYVNVMHAIFVFNYLKTKNGKKAC